MKTTFLAAAFAMTATVPLAQDAPRFFSETYPSHALGPAMQWYGSLGGEGAELDTASRELVLLGVSAQISCDYCVYAHAKNARAAGATEVQIKEAIAAAAAVRMWSAVLNGMGHDYADFTAAIDSMHASTGQCLVIRASARHWPPRLGKPVL